MIAWTCLALLATAAAAPAAAPASSAEDSAPTSQVSKRQTIISASQIPLANGFQNQGLPINYQTIQPQYQSIQPQYQSIQTVQPQYQSIQPQYQSIQTVQPQYHSIQTVQPQYHSIQTVQPQYQSIQAVQPQLSYQSLPVNSLNYQPLRVQQIKPVTQLRTQSLQASLPIVSTTAAPLRVQPQVHSIQVQPQVHSIQVQPQVHSIAVQPQVHSVAVQPQVHTIQVQQRLSQPQQGLAILRQVQDVQADGTYAFAFETENGIKAQEEGRTVNQGTDAESNVVQGSYSYTAPDGTPITVNYVADENGFRAEGEHIPKPSEAILRSLEYLRSLPPSPQDNNEGRYVPDKNRY